MKILHVLDHSLPHYDGYAFRSAEIIQFQRRRGIETVQVTSPKHAGGATGSEMTDGVEYHRTDARGGMFSLPVLDQIGVVIALEARIAGLIAEHRPQLVHAHSPSLNGLAALRAARPARIPVVYEMRSFWEDAAVDAGSCREGDLRYRLTRASETHVVRHATHVVPICQGIAADLRGRGVPDERLTVIANAVDFARFHRRGERAETIAARHDLHRGHTVGFAGSFFAFEGLEVLIDAADALAARDPLFRVLLIGSGVEAERLRAHVAARGLGSCVVFTGRVPHAEMEAYYSVMDALVYPRIPMRLTELVTPLKPLEAMAKGIAVIASDVGGHRELISDGATGLLFRAGDSANLAAVIDRLLGDAALMAGLVERALEHVRTRHDWALNVENYVKLYERLLA